MFFHTYPQRRTWDCPGSCLIIFQARSHASQFVIPGSTVLLISGQHGAPIHQSQDHPGCYINGISHASNTRITCRRTLLPCGEAQPWCCSNDRSRWGYVGLGAWWCNLCSGLLIHLVTLLYVLTCHLVLFCSVAYYTYSKRKHLKKRWATNMQLVQYCACGIMFTRFESY